MQMPVIHIYVRQVDKGVLLFSGTWWGFNISKGAITHSSTQFFAQ